MAIELCVKLTQTIGLPDLLIRSREVLQEILNISPIPPLQSIGSYASEHVIPAEPGLITIEGEECGVSLTVVEVPPHEMDPTGEETGVWAFFSVAYRVPLSVALVAALAAVAAERTHIIDEDSLWTEKRVVSAEYLIQSVRLAERASDLLAAAQTFVAKLPRGWK